MIRHGRSLENLKMWIDGKRVLPEDFRFRIKVGNEVNLVDEENTGIPEHRGVFQWFVVTFRGASDNNFDILPEVIVRRTYQISHILDDEEIKSGEVQRAE